MAHTVIDQLEPVNIDKHQSQRLSLPLGIFDRGFNTAGKLPLIGQLSHGIVGS